MTRSSSPSDLFSPVDFGALTLANRIVMAPLTRSRMGADGVPSEMHARYYAQRASAGLIISEATNISAQGRGYDLTPGIWSEEQVAGWKVVTDAVHAAGVATTLGGLFAFDRVELLKNLDRNREIIVLEFVDRLGVVEKYVRIENVGLSPNPYLYVLLR
jgi:hypothetical protein